MYLIVVPIEGFEQSKTRLRNSLPTDSHNLVTELARKMALHTLKTLNNLKDFELLILTPRTSGKFFDQIKNIKNIIYDTNNSIDDNVYLNKTIEQLIHQYKDKYSGIFIIMSDLPLIAQASLQKIRKIASKDYIQIVPALKDNGTSLLYYPNSTLQSADIEHCFFGHNSSIKFTAFFKQKKVKYELLKDQKLGFDLDTIDDVRKLSQLDSPFSNLVKKIISSAEPK